MDSYGDPDRSSGVHCPICGIFYPQAADHSRHIRWTFEQGNPIEFARFAMTASPYVRGIGARLTDIPAGWWEQRGEWVVERVMRYFEAADGYVFGEVAQLDLLAMDIWKEFSAPEEEQSAPHHASAGDADAA